LSRTVWAVSLPLLFAGISETVIHVMDTAFLGRVGTTELAALGLADTLLDTLIVPVIGLAEAMQIVIGRRVGQHKEELVIPTFLRGMLLILVISAGLAAALHLGAPMISQALAESPHVAEAMERFLSIAAYGVIFFALSLGYSALYVGLARTAILTFATILVAATNFVVSYSLILGKLGQPKLGIEGAAWAFVAAELAAFLFLTTYTVINQVRRQKEKFAWYAWVSAPAFGPLLRLSPPVALRALFEGIRWLVFFIIVEQVSEQALAWSNLIYACYLILLIPADAVGEGAHSLVSNLVGQNQLSEIVPLVTRAARITYLITGPLATFVIIVPDWVLGLFTNDPAAVAGAAPSLRVVAVAMVVIVPAEISLAAVAGTGATGTASVIELVLSVILLASAYLILLTVHLPLPYVWTALFISALVALALAQCWLASRRFRHL
jgi:putative MATE family efflux protein